MNKILRFSKSNLVDINEHLYNGWSHLINTCTDEFSLSPGWLKCTALSQNMLDAIRVSSCHINDECIGVLPFFEETQKIYGLPLNTFEMPGRKLVSYHEEIVSKEAHMELLRNLLIDSNEKWHMFSAPAIQRNSLTALAIEEFCAENNFIFLKYPGDKSPYLKMTGDWDEFLSTKSSNFRYTLKRKEKTLKKAGEISVRWYQSVSELDDLYRDILEVEKTSWKISANMSISQSEIEQNYYKYLLPYLADENVLFANVLYLNNSPIAYSLCYMFKGRVGQIKTSFNDAYNKLSPGLIVNKHAIKKSFEIGAQEFDFLGDVMPHKVHWTSLVRKHDTYYVLSNRLRSRLAGVLKKTVWAIVGVNKHKTKGRGESL